MAVPLPEVTAVVREILRDDEIELQRGTRFDDIQGWDPMDLVSVVVELECRMDVQFELAEIDRLSTVDDLLQMLVAKRGLAMA